MVFAAGLHTALPGIFCCLTHKRCNRFDDLFVAFDPRIALIIAPCDVVAQQWDLAFCRNIDMPAEPFQLLFRLLHEEICSRRVDWNLQSLLLCMRIQCLRILHRCAAVRCFIIQHQLYPLAAIFLCLVDGIKACKSPVLIQPFKAVSTDTTFHVPLLFRLLCEMPSITNISDSGMGARNIFYKKIVRFLLKNGQFSLSSQPFRPLD